MYTSILIAIFFMILLQWLAIVVFVVLQNRYTFRPKATASLLAAQLLDDYSAIELTEDGVSKYVTDRYTRLVATFGLPIGATDAVVSHAWRLIEHAQGEQVINVINRIYT